MLHIVNDAKLINHYTETHYRFYTQIDLSQYPQVHDFYEIVLVTDGVLKLTLCGKSFVLQSGQIALIRPGDIHSKAGEESAHINLAFPSSAIEALFYYLCDPKGEMRLQDMTVVPPVQLGQLEFLALQEKMQWLNMIPVNEGERIRTILRHLLFDVVTRYFLPPQEDSAFHQTVPSWLASALTLWQSGEHRSEGLDFLCIASGRSKEHICRTFKQCFGVTPSTYLNRQRLNYAVNLLLHSDYSVTDIGYESGFGSSGRFYHVFHEVYGTSPKKFLQQYNTRTLDTWKCE